ncbi:ABC transporter permease [Sporohalobacter salinus]|uniref:ABC transporter permease n=1 Tax=Sporohalobacter salinus TaxID=1494606 RepID=UPI00195FE5AD|nr:ABC transporter permease [Sporohalobacter salinus]MBM7622611.1 ribose transport system permease protein [Sporohalobacter salinus]
MNLNKVRKYGIFVALLALIIFFTISSDAFFTFGNLINITRQISMLGIAAVGMAFVLLLGGIDLSIGSQVSLVNIIAAWLMAKAGMNPVFAIVISLSVSTFYGFMNGWIIANIKMPPLIVTLAGMTILQGAAYIISDGVPIFGFPESFSVIGQGYVGFIPVPVIIMVVIMLIGSFILNKTYFGRYFYAVGDNEEASELSGINVKKVKYLVYTLSGLFAGIAGIVMLSRTNSGQAIAGKGFELDVLTAVVLGGVSITGGYGKIFHVVAGVLIMGVLSNGMVLINVSEYYQLVIKGLVLLLAVGFDSYQKHVANAS